MRQHIALSSIAQDADLMTQLQADLSAKGMMIQTLIPETASQSEIEQAIHEAVCFVVIVSPDAMSSHALKAIIAHAEAQHKPILSVFTKGDKPSAVETFNKHLWRDLRNPDDYQAFLPALIADLMQLI